MAFDVKSFAREVHENAKAHGWYDPPPTAEERIAAIHSEWSEAFQAWRKDEPAYTIKQICMSKDKLADCEDTVYCNTCEHALHKPDGWAVELIDGVLRMLEWMAAEGVEIDPKPIEKIPADIPKLIAMLHYQTSCLIDELTEAGSFCGDEWKGWLNHAIGDVVYTLRTQELDVVRIMQEKHAYNRTRPYRHGGKKC